MEATFLDDQLDKFHSDFRIIVEYFVNKRKNMDYVPSPQEIKHVDEFLKLMQVLEGDNWYEEVLHAWQKEEKKKGLRMGKALDRTGQRGWEETANDINQLITILLE